MTTFGVLAFSSLMASGFDPLGFTRYTIASCTPLLLGSTTRRSSRIGLDAAQTFGSLDALPTASSTFGSGASPSKTSFPLIVPNSPSAVVRPAASRPTGGVASAWDSKVHAAARTRRAAERQVPKERRPKAKRELSVIRGHPFFVKWWEL